MGGIDVAVGGGGRRRTLDSEINMIPMIDLLMVTISFLLITAVWSHMTRIDVDARVPGAPDTPPAQVEKKLHVTMQGDDRFVLAWKAGTVTLDSIEVPRRAAVVGADGQGVAFPELAEKIASEWRAKGQHSSPRDGALDQAVLHTDDRTEYRYIVGVMDAIEGTKRELALGARAQKVPAFNVTFAMN
jgi:biopolymer transport protein ExbD